MLRQNYLKGDDVVATTAEAAVAEAPKPVAKGKVKSAETKPSEGE